MFLESWQLQSREKIEPFTHAPFPLSSSSKAISTLIPIDRRSEGLRGSALPARFAVTYRHHVQYQLVIAIAFLQQIIEFFLQIFIEMDGCSALPADQMMVGEVRENLVPQTMFAREIGPRHQLEFL